VSENEPYIAAFVWTNPVSKGRIRTVRMTIYNDTLSRDAPLSRNDNVKLLSIVEADVNHIPENQLRRKKGYDGQWYYELNCKIEAVYTSASTGYTLIYQSKFRGGDFVMLYVNCLDRPALSYCVM
jgi:hypothetical protein